MSADYFGFSLLRSDHHQRSKNDVVLNNAADISVIVIYFVVVLAVGVWVSFSASYKEAFTVESLDNPLLNRVNP